MKKEIILAGSNVLLLKESDGRLRLPYAGEVRLRAESAETFEFGDYTVSTADTLEEGESARCVETGVREAYGALPHEIYNAVVKGAELINWSEGERFCSKCGSLLRRHTSISKLCPSCQREYFPRLSPAIVVLVKKGEKALLVHARNFSRPEMMALVAGFVETGESLEQCVAREVKEETNLDVEDITYIGSQSWPFPHQLMIGFTARYAGGELRYADGELSAGRFFSRDEMPPLPTLPSLSRQIIDMWISGKC